MSVTPLRRSRLVALLTLALTCATAWVGGSAGSAAAQPSTSKIPAGTVLNVGDQDQELETLVCSTPASAKAAPFKINFVEFDSGPLVNAGFAAKQIDVGDMGDLPASLAVQSGLPVKAVAVDLPIGASEYLLAKPGITKISQLRGKPVAYTTGTAEQAFALRALATAGLTQKDVQQVNVSLQQLGTALESGSADASVVSVEQKVDYQETAPTAKVLATVESVQPAELRVPARHDGGTGQPGQARRDRRLHQVPDRGLQLGQDAPESVHQRLLRERRTPDAGSGEADPRRRRDRQLRPHHGRGAIGPADRRQAPRRRRRDLEVTTASPRCSARQNPPATTRSSRRFRKNDPDHFPISATTSSRGVTVTAGGRPDRCRDLRCRHLPTTRLRDARRHSERARHVEGGVLP